MNLVLGQDIPGLQVAIDQDGIMSIADLLSLSTVCIRELHLSVSTRNLEAIVPALQRIMYELSKVDTVRAMTWNFDDCDIDCVAAVCSALPSMRVLTTFGIVVDTLNDSTGPLEKDGAESMYHRWLAYALVKRKLEGIPFAFSTKITREFRCELDEAMATPNCLVEAIPELIRMYYPPVHHNIGVTAEIVEDTLLTNNPLCCTPKRSY